MESDMFVYNGGESDSWVKNIIEDKSMNKDCKILSLMDLVQKDLLIKTSHDDDHHHDESLSDKSEIETVDEHVWLSITNSIDICEKLCNIITVLDESNKETYKKNFESYRDKLLQLHSDAINMFAPYDARYVIVADRFPFVYFFRDYRIKYNAAFSGCSADTEATYENIIKLCEDIKNNNINSILVLDKSTTNISSSIISSVDKDLKVYTLNSLQSVSRDDINNGVTYYDAMKKNIDALKNSLS
jgi:zinc transport system substrate-binding protein